MRSLSRRGLIQTGGAGLAALLAGGGSLLLAEDAPPTPGADDLHGYLDFQRAAAPAHGAPQTTKLPATPEQILGPYHRTGAPFRGKVTPPLEPGRVLLVRGRVWGVDTKAPLPGVTLDIWQANAAGHYDMSHPDYPLEEGIFLYRTRLVTDETGYYEFETVYPGRYLVGPERYRPAHIHYWVRRDGYRELVTQLYFEGDPWNARERGMQPSLIRPLQKIARGMGEFETCEFDVVLAAG